MRHSVISLDQAEPQTATPDAASVRDAQDKSLASRKASIRALGIRKLLIKQSVPLLATLIIGWILWGKAATLDISAIWNTVSTVSVMQWSGALLATAGSFWAVGQYDTVLHAQLGTGISRSAGRRTGVAAIGLSQFLGFGALTGALIRWRMLPELTLWQSTRLSAAIALSFLAGWALVAALAVLILQPDIPWMKSLATLAIVLTGGMALLSIYPPAKLVRFPWPSLRTMGTVVMLAAIDTVLAGLTLYILLPPEVAIGMGQLIAAYLFALGAGMIGSTPGGIGPFEAMLASLLPMAPLEPLLGAVVAYRLVYYGVPATISAIIVLRGPRKCNLSAEAQLTKASTSPFLPPKMELQLFSAPRAETNLLRTRDFSLLTDRNEESLALAAPIGQSLVMLSDPINAKMCRKDALSALQQAARARYRMPAIYKCGGRMALCARKAGWSVIPTAQEAWLTPAQFNTDGSERRQLRRQLKKAAEAGITVCEGGRTLPLADMDRVAAEWKAIRGKERGFSMGTYDRAYVTCQRVFLAYKEDELVAFITLHETRNEMTLDLMRNTAESPDGTIQLLITHAIKAAADYGCPRLSLAAVPWSGEDSHWFTRTLRQRFLKQSGHTGLRRFKAAFGPHWETLYVAAPNNVALWVACMDVVRRVTAPPRMQADNPMKAHRFSTHPTLRFFKRAPKAATHKK